MINGMFLNVTINATSSNQNGVSIIQTQLIMIECRMPVEIKSDHI